MNRRADVRGFSLIELMVALVVALFLLLALFTVFATVRNTLQAQQGLTQLQEDERIAMTLLANAVQPAGYFPSPNTATRAASYPSDPTFVSAGQVVFGTHNAAAPGDTFTVRFVGDTVTAGNPPKATDCLGAAATPGAVEVNQVLVNATTQLACSVNGAASLPLVGMPGVTPQGVQSMQVLYGVDTTGAKSVTRYLTADQVTAATQWSSVLSLSVTLTFVNPRKNQHGEPATLSISRVMALQNNLL